MIDIKKFIKNSVLYCIPAIFSAAVGLIAIPVISSYFPAEEYGKINMFYSVGNMMLYIVTLGLDNAYIRFFYDDSSDINRKTIYPVCVWVSMAVSTIVFLLSLTLFRERIGLLLFGESKILPIVLLFIYVISLVFFRLLNIESRMDNDVKSYNIQQILLTITNRISFVFIVFYSENYLYSILVITISTLMISAFYAIKQKGINDLRWPDVDTGKMKALLAFSLPLMPLSLMTWLNNSLSKFVLTNYGDFNAVGILTIATSLANVFSIVPSAFSTYWSPFMYSNHKKEKTFICNVHDFISFGSLAIVIGIFLFQDVLYYFVNGSYKISQPYFMLIMLTPIVSLLCETTSYGIILSNKTKYTLYISIACVLANTLLGFALYPLLNIYAVVLGIAFSAVLQFVLKTVIGQHFYKSINSYINTTIMFGLIVLLCCANVLCFESLPKRIMISVAAFLVALIVNWKYIKKICEGLRRAK